MSANHDFQESFRAFGRKVFHPKIVDGQQIGLEKTRERALSLGGGLVGLQIARQIEDRAVEHDQTGFDRAVADGLGQAALTDDRAELVRELRGYVLLCGRWHRAKLCNPVEPVEGRLKHLCLQLTDGSFDQPGESHFGQVNLSGIYAERPRYFAHRFPQDDVQMINLVVLRMHLPLDPSQRSVQQALLPFLIPNRGQVEARRVRDALHGGRARALLAGHSSRRDEALALSALPLLELVEDTPARHSEQPAFERVNGRIVSEARHLFGH